MTRKEPVRETKKGKIVGLLMDGKGYTVAQLIKQSGSSEASVRMYIAQSYLDRKKEPYKVIIQGEGDKATYKYIGKKK
jgi:glutathione synthase/RimK-type ligase-like ATP-grasp enzyme